jgi:hypothetical protein
MIKKFTFTILLAFACSIGYAQVWGNSHLLDSLKHELAKAKEDTIRVLIMAKLCNLYANSDFDSANLYGQRAWH